MLLTKEELNEIKSKAVEATSELREKFIPAAEQLAKYEADKRKAFEAKAGDASAKEFDIIEAISKIPVCDDGKKAICELVKVVAGLDIVMLEAPDVSKWMDWIPFSIMVPTKNDNHHDYPVDKPVMMLDKLFMSGGDKGVQMSGYIGNHLEWDRAGLRPATEEELEMFFKLWDILVEADLPLMHKIDKLDLLKAVRVGDE